MTKVVPIRTRQHEFVAKLRNLFDEYEADVSSAVTLIVAPSSTTPDEQTVHTIRHRKTEHPYILVGVLEAEKMRVLLKCDESIQELVEDLR